MNVTRESGQEYGGMCSTSLKTYTNTLLHQITDRKPATCHK